MKYAAEINASNVVQQVIVLPDTSTAETCAATFGGTWVYTRAPGDPANKCADVGDTYDPVTGNFTTPPGIPGNAQVDLEGMMEP